MQASRQDELFPDLSTRPETRLRLERPAGKAFTKRQKQFNQQLRKLEKLRAEYQKTVACWEHFLESYTREIRPAELAQNTQRLAFIKHLAALWQGRPRLGKNQRATVAKILERELSLAAAIQPELPGHHPELDAVAEALEKSRDDALRAAHAELRREMKGLDPEEAEYLDETLADFLDDLGFDGACFSASMSADEFTAEMERQKHVQADFFAEDEDSDGPPPRYRERAQTAAQKRAAAKAAEKEKARQRTLAMIYKQLAKVLHPDLEQDPARRAEKHRVMQELTAAYRDHDLHTLLRLELEWLEGENDRLEALGDEKLAIYLEVLREQVREVEASLRGVPGEPRFQAVAHFAAPYQRVPRRPVEILPEIARETEDLAATVARLQGPGARACVRELIHAEQERRKFEATLALFPF